MKKILLILMLITASLVSFTSCKDEEENPMVNTKWATKVITSYDWIYFTSETEFFNFMGDESGIPPSDLEYGTYKFSNGKVEFISHDSYFPFDKATLNDDILNVTFRSGSTRIYTKR